MLKDTDPMPWGKYGPKPKGEGKTMAEVPDEYLLWLHNAGKAWGPVKFYILKNIDAIQANVNRKNK